MENKSFKVLLLIATVFLFTSGCSTVKIDKDYKVKNSERFISTKPVEMKIGEALYEFNLNLFIIDEIKTYAISVASSRLLQKDNIMLIKLGNEEIVKLSANSVTSSQEINYYLAFFDIDSETLNRIDKYGINKIRIEYGNTFFEQNFLSNKLGKYISMSHRKIDEKINNLSKTTPSIEEGF